MTKEENEMSLFRDHVFAARNSAVATVSGIAYIIMQSSLLLQLAGLFFCLSNGVITIRMLRSNKAFGRQTTNTAVQKLATHSSLALLFVPLSLLTQKNKDAS